MRNINEILFSEKQFDIIFIQPNFLMKILEKDQNEIVKQYWKSMHNQEPLGDLPNEVNHGLFSLASSVLEAGYTTDILDFQAYDRHLRDIEKRLISSEDIKKSIKTKKAKIFAISTITVSSQNSLNIAKIIRYYHPNSTIIFGGMHPTLFHKEFIKEKEVDIIILGEGNKTILEILEVSITQENLKKIRGIIFKDEHGIAISTPKKSNNHLNLDSLHYKMYLM